MLGDERLPEEDEEDEEGDGGEYGGSDDEIDDGSDGEIDDGSDGDEPKPLIPLKRSGDEQVNRDRKRRT